MLIIPKTIPEKGFYYHYKHNPQGSVNNYAYEIMGIGSHTEEDETFFVVYRPLYESSLYMAGKFFDVRPIEMFLEEVSKDGRTFPRFTKITDTKVVTELEKIKEEMYN
ncbi:MAG TPA: DUF1653 domain-containing protein [Candidatus Paceibacterota bacterium]|jgi:hypothetical protein|nr:DUF1653 domain-containing protein [Candidatus Paceibacterota bacterium]